MTEIKFGVSPTSHTVEHACVIRDFESSATLQINEKAFHAPCGNKLAIGDVLTLENTPTINATVRVVEK